MQFADNADPDQPAHADLDLRCPLTDQRMPKMSTKREYQDQTARIRMLFCIFAVRI